MRRIVALLLVLVCFVGGAFYLFRTETIDAGEKGAMTAHYRWGALREIVYDANRDGRGDAWVYLPRGESLDAIEIWKPTLSSLDSDFDGIVDIVWETRTQNGLEITNYWVDTDEDGSLDVVSCGDEGRNWLVLLGEKQEARIQRPWR